MSFYAHLIARTPKFDFVGKRIPAFVLTAALIIGTFVSIATRGFNFGIDFAGGILVEVQSIDGPANIANMRDVLGNLGLGEVSLQQFGESGRDVMVRVQKQDGDEKVQMAALAKVKDTLGNGYEYRRVEIVGPKVGDELKRDGVLAVILAVLAIAAYVWFRFEWQFGAGALIATFHDVVLTFGFFSITGMEFNLTSVAAILTIAGYSINDTVVIYDRVRENLRKYKTLSLYDLLNLAVNETLARTFLTVATVFVTVLALLLLGGDVLHGFAAAMLWGLVVGTFSSMYVAIPVLIYFKIRVGKDREEDETASQAMP
ncbi:protein translocase subunit SecF [Magnetospirillum sulfuroxidans]|uniref:Protein-export membrane protein SecF n=1 Tax=Magnetospirillum sulfuroxidans TaxID=611300 RepID=A0ABS5I7S0_9PROT|nr:protein translocase subunit SecF [Magnetospirillum sulfuroxidans]MBR9970484.1 protein translocase subunit SecF [Magnetospirillum sulfuroxidans]